MPGTSFSGLRDQRHVIAACLLLALEPAIAIIGPLVGVVIFGGWAPMWTYVTAQAVNSLLVAALAARVVHGIGGCAYRSQPLHLLSGVMCTVLFYPGALLLAELVGRVAPDDSVSSAVLGSVAMGPVLAWITMALLPAVSEELLFRGAVFGSFRRYGSVPAILVSAAMFSLFHGNLQQMSYTFLMGLAWACLREFSGSVLPGMLGHMAFNSVALMAAFQPAGTVPSQPTDIMPLAALSVPMAAGGILLLKAMSDKSPWEKPVPERPGAAPFVMAAAAIGIYFAIGMAVASI